MTTLALEFSSVQRSVAVLREPAQARPVLEPGNEGDAIPPLSARLSLAEVVEALPGRTMHPFAMIEEALRQAGVEREAVGRLAIGLGPGSYAGIRAAIAVAQGWQLALGAQLLGISSAEAIAAEAESAGLRGRVNVIIDAQRHEFYLATWEIAAGGRREIESLRLVPRDEIERRTAAGEACVGPEIPGCAPLARRLFPRAATLARLASGRTDFTPGDRLEPIYLREVAFVKAPPSRVIPD